MESVQTVQFERPPVRQVSLTVYFKPLLGLNVSHLANFIESLHSDYPDSQELPPLSSRFSDELETEVLPISSTVWPFPYLLLADPERGHHLAVQNDRLIRTWEFTNDVAYPGFNKLSSDLEEKFNSLSLVVKDRLGETPELVGAECFYRNSIDIVDSVEELAVGVLTRWQSSPGPALGATYVGIRTHFDIDDEAGGLCGITVGVNGNDEEVPELTIESGRKLRNNEQLELGGLRIAHDQLIRYFLLSTSERMQSAWGRIG